jgi:hypothetical protein
MTVIKGTKNATSICAANTCADSRERIDGDDSPGESLGLQMADQGYGGSESQKNDVRSSTVNAGMTVIGQGGRRNDFLEKERWKHEVVMDVQCSSCAVGDDGYGGSRPVRNRRLEELRLC